GDVRGCHRGAADGVEGAQVEGTRAVAEVEAGRADRQVGTARGGDRLTGRRDVGVGRDVAGLATRGVVRHHAVTGPGVLVEVGRHRDDAAGRVLAGRVGQAGRAVTAVVARCPHGDDTLGGE